MDSIEAALEYLGPLKPGLSFNYVLVARKFGVNRLTLSRRHKGIQGPKSKQYEKQQLLNHQQEKELVQWINQLSRRGLFISHAMLRNFAFNVCQKDPGIHWPSRFLERHKDELVCRYTTGIDAARKKADSVAYYTLYFELLARKIQEYEIRPEDMYNMDEKGFLIRVLLKAKRIFSRRDNETDGSQQRV